MTLCQILLGATCDTTFWDGRTDKRKSREHEKNNKILLFLAEEGFFWHVININKRKFFCHKHFFYISHIVIEIGLLKYSVIFLQFYDNGP